jgi:hypothetical protein
MAFAPAERKNAKLRLALQGTSGSGKTMTAQKLAAQFGKKVCVIDSEKGSASLYVGQPGIPSFDVAELEDQSIQNYLGTLKEAAEAGYDVVVVDTYSHAWMWALGAIDRGGGWTKAGKSISPLVDRLVLAILNYPGHVIATLRAKTEYAIETEGGKTTMKKLGLGPVARPDTEYEFTVVLELTREGAVTVSKSRCGAWLPMDAIYERNRDLPKIAANLKAWLSEGAPVSPRDAMADRIRFASDDAALQALVPELGQLSPEDRAALRPTFMARKAEFQGATP